MPIKWSSSSLLFLFFCVRWQADSIMYIIYYMETARAFPTTQLVKNLPAMQETQVQCLGQEDPLEKEMATQSNILAWKIPWTEEPGGLQSKESQRVGHNWATKHNMETAKTSLKKMAVLPVIEACCKVVVIKTVFRWFNDRLTNKTKRDNWISDIWFVTKVRIQMGLFNKLCCENWMSMWKN